MYGKLSEYVASFLTLNTEFSSVFKQVIDKHWYVIKQMFKKSLFLVVSGRAGEIIQEYNQISSDSWLQRIRKLLFSNTCQLNPYHLYNLHFFFENTFFYYTLLVLLCKSMGAITSHCGLFFPIIAIWYNLKVLHISLLKVT